MKKIDINKVEKRLDSIIATSEFSKLQDVIIFQDTDGAYKLFNKYSLKKTSDTDVVVSLIKGDEINCFFSIKNAVCWCVFDKLGKYRLADRVIDLDMSLSSVEVHIAIHSKLFKKAKKTEDKLIYLAKLNQDRLQKKAMSEELSQYIQNSYTWQQKRFGLKSEH
jgi:hypothetical protein